MAPRLPAAPIAARPATPAPMIITLAGGTAGGGNLAGEEAAELMRRFDDRAVAGDVGHRAQRIHRLGARDARTESIASAVTLRAASLAINSGFCAGQIKLTSVLPSRIKAISSSCGALTFRIRSDCHTSLSSTSAAPAAS